MDEPTPVDLIPRDQVLAAIRAFTQDMSTITSRHRRHYRDLERKYERSQAARAGDTEWMFDRAHHLLTLVKATPQTLEQMEKRDPRIPNFQCTGGRLWLTPSGGVGEPILLKGVFHGEDATNADMFSDDISRWVRSTITGARSLSSLMAALGLASHTPSSTTSQTTRQSCMGPSICSLRMSQTSGKPWLLEYTSVELWKPSDPIRTKSEALARVEPLDQARIRPCTNGNSRSHGIFDLQVYDSNSLLRGRLTVVDLAGIPDHQVSQGHQEDTQLAGGAEERSCLTADLSRLKRFLVPLSDADRPGLRKAAMINCGESALSRLLGRTLDVSAREPLPGIVFVGFILTHGDNETYLKGSRTLRFASQLGTMISDASTPTVHTQSDGPAMLSAGWIPEGDAHTTTDQVVTEALMAENGALRQLLNGIGIDHHGVTSPDAEVEDV
ncbi:hypothetical protein FB567DRAFT_554624 [Paraphoma chrysanthemicola]|uniref:Uncharacterized protein n=1 Tax=Paraphoma chrysanthemicola TaxID=798071 RepID=A0A8K0QUI5_9PLEO|nr:hypothetical protein FB567DRAFT_554624 [Paraphoma chrysanthemicola]